jgi:hypothetical protein
MRPDEIIKIVEYIKEQTGHKGDIFININKNAIPIEWIERKLAEHWYVDYDIREMLEDWEKENEKDI